MKSIPRIIAVSGPTCSGKSSLARKIAKRWNGELVNFDSRQIYSKLTIGTAKDNIDKRLSVKSSETDGVVQHLSDFVDPKTPYNLAQFQKDAHEIITDIINRGKLPILVGGTGLYLDAVVYNFQLVEEHTANIFREQLQHTDTYDLQKILIDENSELFESMTNSDQKNPHRLIRAIERIRTSKGSSTRGPLRYTTLNLVVNIPSQVLHKRIKIRVLKMFKDGLEEENRQLRAHGYTTALSSMRSIGYQEFDEYFAGHQTLDETQQLIELHTVQYARRQLTWFKRTKDTTWVSSKDSAFRKVKAFLLIPTASSL